MLLFTVLALSLAIGYILLMNQYLSGWRALSSWQLPAKNSVEMAIDVIVPARNEAMVVETCLRSILDNQYPAHLFQVWLVDDFSTDETPGIVRNLQREYPNLHLLSLADYQHELQGVAFKKQGIAKAIELSSADLIVCTDADCTVPNDWLSNFAAFFAERLVVMATAPVLFEESKGTPSALVRFQELDVMGMMLITGAGIQQDWMRMANGANLAYLRSAYAKVNGFQGIDDLASGDDMLLMQKMVKIGQVGYVKSAGMAVLTAPEKTYSSFIQQRIRWASKSGRYTERKVIWALALVFLYTCTILLSAVLIIWRPVWASSLFLLLFLLKSGTDYYFLSQAADFFGRKSSLKNYWLSQIHHVGYIAVVGLLANFRKTYYWKGRKVY